MKANSRYPSGENHPRSKLSAKQVVNIRRQYDAGSGTYRGLAKQYGVSCATIYDILINRTWRGFTDD